MRSIPPPKPVVGDKYGFLTILDEGIRVPGAKPHYPHKLMVLVRCECGKEKRVIWDNIRRGNSTSCGCLHRKQLVERIRKHGDTFTPLHNRWCGMITRCENPNATSYKRYGGRGITVCPEWHDFAVFKEWAIANGYEEGLDIDRIDNDKGYSPDNCRYATRRANCNNRSITINITAWGETKSITEWVADERCAVSYSGLYARLKNGWQSEAAIGQPKGRERDAKGVFLPSPHTSNHPSPGCNKSTVSLS